MHHTLLHSEDEALDKNENSVAVLNDINPISPIVNKVPLNTIDETVANVQNMQPPDTGTPSVLLATAWIDLHMTEGRCFRVRALLDQGFIFSFISESLGQALRTNRQRTDLKIKCFGEQFTGSARSCVSLRLTPRSKPKPTFPLDSLHLSMYHVIRSVSNPTFRVVATLTESNVR